VDRFKTKRAKKEIDSDKNAEEIEVTKTNKQKPKNAKQNEKTAICISWIMWPGEKSMMR